MKFRREKMLALFVGACMVFALCMTAFVPTADAVESLTQPGHVSQGDSEVHFFNIPSGPDVTIELSWVEPPGENIDLDLLVIGWGYIGATWNNPEIGFITHITEPTTLVVVVEGYYVPGDGVDYILTVTYGSDLFPVIDVEPGGLTVGDLTSWHHASRMGLYSANYKSAHSYVFSSEPWRQTLMPFYAFYPYNVRAYYADEALLVGGLAWWWWMAEYTYQEAKMDLATYTVEYSVDGTPIEDLGHATEGPIRADMYQQQWYWRLPTVIFKPGELYDVLDMPDDYLHYFQYTLNGFVLYTGYFYLHT
ncbi:MAG: hypothetical protein ACFFEF_19900 [Candidatus Thorarchaeota archaeon]